MKISINPAIKQACPEMRLLCLEAKVSIEATQTDLWAKIEATTNSKSEMAMETIKDIPAIAASRNAYKALGKAPSRYRLSAEALHRRIVKGTGLYQISNVVEIINLTSLISGFSIGGYDADKIKGDIALSLGLASDDYDAIGRGKLNIEKLPVFRDQLSAFGSPTSDSTRTCITNETGRILLIFLDFASDEAVFEAAAQCQTLLVAHAAATDVQLHTVL
ncbi:MAG: phenylalanine--tRNA ligase beta subunit-related protein [Bacteroidota bacterium]